MKIEMHCHTGGTSDCAKVEPEKIPDLFLEAGYNAVFITNHLYPNSKAFLQEPSDRAVADRLLKAFKTVRMIGEPKGLRVWLGMEVTITVDGFATDMLLYGIDERFVLDNAKMYTYNCRQLADAVHEIGGMIYQAHPFRTFPPPNLAPVRDIDGIESYNGNPRHFCNYLLAREYAIKSNLRQISGGDFHQEGDQNRGGIIVPDTITSPSQLISHLKFQKPRMFFAETGLNAFKAGNSMVINQ